MVAALTLTLLSSSLPTTHVQILYILRPLIYALLVHQIDQYREHRQSHSDNNSTPNNSLANANGAGNTAATVSANGNTAITTTTISSITGRIAEYIASAGNSALTRVLDSISVDALLSALALAVSFVSASTHYFAYFSVHRIYYIQRPRLLYEALFKAVA